MPFCSSCSTLHSLLMHKFMCAILCLCKFSVCAVNRSLQCTMLHVKERKKESVMTFMLQMVHRHEKSAAFATRERVSQRKLLLQCIAFAKLFNFFFDIEFFFCRSLFLSHSRFSLEIWLFLNVLLLLCFICLEYSRMNCNFEFLDIEDWRCDENEKKKSHLFPIFCFLAFKLQKSIWNFCAQRFT